MTVMGMTLGSPVQITECQNVKNGGIKIYNNNITTPCVQDGWQNYRYEFLPVKPQVLMLPVDEYPSYVNYPGVWMIEIDGDLESVDIHTWGIEAQGRAFNDLHKKYGKPTSYMTQYVQNRMGAKYKSIIAVWEFKALKVTFYGTTDRLDEGIIMVRTNKAQELFKKVVDEVQQKKKAL